MKTLEQMKEALTSKGVRIDARFGEAKIKALCAANGIAVDDEASVAEPATADAENVISTAFGTFRPKKATDVTITEFVAKKAAREFPNFIGKLPEGIYSTCGTCDVYKWTHIVDGTEETTELLVVFLANKTTGEIFPVGSWDVCSRTMSVKLVDGTEITPKWVEPTKFTSNSERDRLAANLPEGIDVVLKSGVGHWHNPLKESTRNFNIAWLERAE